MRKLLKSKHGFTLVELMIVVVILGILVAIAVPIFGAVTRNSKRKACRSTQKIIETAAVQFYLSDTRENFDDLFGSETNNSLDLSGQSARDSLEAGFKNCFKGAVFPVCNETGYGYIITREDHDSRQVVAQCTNSDHNA